MDMNESESSWVPDDALNSLVTERTIHPEEDNEATARRLLRENVAASVLGIVHTAIHGTNERTRLDAQKYVVERVLGRVGDDAYGATSPVADFISDITGFVAASAGTESAE
jgi:predicted hydrolase (HD superfamily)